MVRIVTLYPGHETAAESPVQPGEVLADKYRINRVLGIGGMGVVVEATHIDLDEPRAIKFILPKAKNTPSAFERFLREAKAASKIRSEHAVRVMDVGRFATGEPYVVMELLTGTDLKGVMRQRGPLPVAEAVRYTCQALEALGEAHQLGIVHRDVKPANLFLATDQHGDHRIKVLDFGISKSTHDVDLTATKEAFGTPAYMAPEQMRGSKDIDGRADLWSIGIILYELLTGEKPFKGDTGPEIVISVVTTQPAPPSALRAGIDPRLDAVVLSCLAKDKAHRIESARSLIDCLAPFCTYQHPETTFRAFTPHQSRDHSSGPFTVGPSLYATGVTGAPALAAQVAPHGPTAPHTQAALHGQPMIATPVSGSTTAALAQTRTASNERTTSPTQGVISAGVASILLLSSLVGTGVYYMSAESNQGEASSPAAAQSQPEEITDTASSAATPPAFEEVAPPAATDSPSAAPQVPLTVIPMDDDTPEAEAPRTTPKGPSPTPRARTAPAPSPSPKKRDPFAGQWNQKP